MRHRAHRDSQSRNKRRVGSEGTRPVEATLHRGGSGIASDSLIRAGSSRPGCDGEKYRYPRRGGGLTYDAGADVPCVTVGESVAGCVPGTVALTGASAIGTAAWPPGTIPAWAGGNAERFSAMSAAGVTRRSWIASSADI